MSRSAKLPHTGLEDRLYPNLASRWLPAGSAIGVAFSGGVDSLALAIALAQVAPHLGLTPILLHVNHGLRSNSGHDAKRCVEIAASIGASIFVDALPSGLAERASGIGIEERARRERYLALARRCKELGAEYLLTAHHMDDQAETVLMHLFRGSGIRGASGIREFAAIEVPWWSPEPDHAGTPYRLVLWRPFLFERKQTLEAYVAGAGFEPVWDESNESREFRRNVLRHEVFPVIEAHWPGSIEAIARFAALASVDEDLLSGMAVDLTAEVLTDDGALRVFDLLGHSFSIATRIVANWLYLNGVKGPTWERVLAVFDLAEEGSESAVLEVGDNRCVVRFGNTLRIGNLDDLIEHAISIAHGLTQRPDLIDNEIESNVEGGVVNAHGSDWTIRVSIESAAEGKSDPGINVNWAPIHTNLTIQDIEIRQVKTGDRWHATGAAVREILRKEGVHPIARDSVVCIASGKQVYFIPGIDLPNRRYDIEAEPLAWLNVQWTRIQRAT